MNTFQVGVVLFSLVVACSKADGDSAGSKSVTAAVSVGAAQTGGLDQCQQCAATHPSCACASPDCVGCLYVGPADSASCVGVPYATRNAACACLASACA